MESDIKEIIALLQELHQKQNLGAISVDGKQLMAAPYKSFMAEFCEKDMGGLVERTQKKPIQLMPVLNLQRDIEKLQKDRERFVGEKLLHHLLELNVYINNSCHLNCPLCDRYFRQSMCCTKQHAPENLDIETIRHLLSQVKNASIGTLNILGGNIALYPHWESLKKLLLDFKEQVRLWVHYVHLITNPIDLEGRYEIPVSFPVDEKAFAESVKIVKSQPACYHFLITGEDDYKQTEDLLTKYHIENHFVHPIYTTGNLSFFEQNIYLCKEDILANTLSFREIFAHQKLNTNFFGSLTVLPNGDVFANVNEACIGNSTALPVLHLIEKEMSDNTAWRRIRDDKPCVDCMYQHLCPSPSNYEKVIKKANLCHIIKQAETSFSTLEHPVSRSFFDTVN